MSNPICLNVLAKDLENAKQITEATKGNVYIGIMVKNFADVEAAVTQVNSYQEAGIPVSVGLGAGDPKEWRRVIDVAVKTKPVHVNQIFPAAGYTLGALERAGSSRTLVNALVAPAGSPGKVSILTGPLSKEYKDVISCEAAAALMQEIGVKSVKFYPIEGCKRLDEVAAMVKAAVKYGITIFEPTGGIDAKSVFPVVKTCLENGVQFVIPHIYTAFVDKETRVTNAEAVAALTNALLL
ncbi:2-dehydro-3-deoxy-phosphogluconate aldolase [Lucifera butyrica]|uniref:2-dehydro-3-deoxy-phosphogluconate aldolase n=1 Tax=Lucifera butyrica TaxID=1351585 RepID=A0A498R7J2_9FIRM|nr:KDGP aldolase [Lucifera butyrica]VBB07189.1 2-dehydro-3-deoxy-phosphogluconate aldolase [Lucifera butyrica]